MKRKTHVHDHFVNTMDLDEMSDDYDEVMRNVKILIITLLHYGEICQRTFFLMRIPMAEK